MGKQNKQKAAPKGGKRTAPYPKKPTKPSVQVTYEGDAPAPAPKAASKPAKAAPKPKAEAPATAVAAPKLDKGKGKAREPTPEEDDERPTFKIIAGSYEKLLYGLEGSYPTGSTTPTLDPLFIFPAHLANVKCVAASPTGKWLATGSEDEFIKVWDLRRRKEVGSLSQHTGSITSVTFPTPSHLVATSDDSTISLFRTSDWALLKSLKGHSGRVNHVDVHPTGRVALSVGKDQTLKMWDLMRGRGAASLALGTEAELVKFSPSGTHFAVLYPKKVEIYSLTLKLLHTLETKSRFNHILFAELPRGEDADEEDPATELLCIGTEKGVVEVYTVEIGQVEPEEDDDEEMDEDEEDEEKEPKGPKAEIDLVAKLVGHTNRIKAVSALTFPAPSGPTVLLTTVSTDGYINLYDLGAIPTSESEEHKPVASYNTKGTRLTCVFIATGGAPRRKGKKTAPAAEKKEVGARFEVDDEEEEDEEDDEEEDDEQVDLYGGSASEKEGEGADGMEVEFEDEEEDEEEEEDEGEYED